MEIENVMKLIYEQFKRGEELPSGWSTKRSEIECTEPVENYPIFVVQEEEDQSEFNSFTVIDARDSCLIFSRFDNIHDCFIDDRHIKVNIKRLKKLHMDTLNIAKQVRCHNYGIALHDIELLRINLSNLMKGE